MFHRAGLVSLVVFFLSAFVVVAVPLPSDSLESFNDIYDRGVTLVPYAFDDDGDDLYVRETDFDDYTLLERDSIPEYPTVNIERRWGFLKKIGGAFRGAVNRVTSAVKNTVKHVANTAKNAVKTGVNIVKQGVKTYGSVIKAGYKIVKQGVKTYGSAIKAGYKFVKKYGPTIAKVGLKALATGGSFTSRFAKFIPGVGVPLAGALKVGSKFANIASNAIPAKLPGALGKTMEVLDVINQPKLPGALGAAASILM